MPSHVGARDPAVPPSSSAGFVPREMADLARHLSSGTTDPETGRRTEESPLPAWDDDDVPDDLVPNRTDLEGGPRQHLTDDLEDARVLRPDPRVIARSMLAAKRARRS